MRGFALNMTDHQVRQFNHHLICHFSNATVKLIQFRERERERKKERKNWDFLAGKKYILKEIEKKERRIEFCLNCRVRKDGKIGERKAGKMREMLSDRTDDCNCQVVQTFLYLALLLGFRRLHTSRGGGWVTWVTWVATFLCVLFPPWPFPLRSH